MASYSFDEKKRAVQILIALNLNLRAAERETKLPPNTLKKWFTDLTGIEYTKNLSGEFKIIEPNPEVKEIVHKEQTTKGIIEPKKKKISKDVTVEFIPESPVIKKEISLSDKIVKNTTKTVELQTNFVVDLAGLKCKVIERLAELVPKSSDMTRLTFLLRTIGELEANPNENKPNSSFNFVQQIYQQIINSQNGKKNSHS